MNPIRREFHDLLSRTTDNNVRIAVTGLSRAGKTAFISSLVNQLLSVSTHENLPLLSASRERRLVGAKRVPQKNMMVPSFPYDEAMSNLSQIPPQWPEPTRDVSETRIILKYRTNKKSRRLFGENSTISLDIVDYPGEWLLDLPLLQMSFAQWSEHQFLALEGQRKEYAQEWLKELNTIDLSASLDEKAIANVAYSYTQFLHRCKANGLHWIQPGRFVLPGELEGAPVLQFFPCKMKDKRDLKGTNYETLEARYREYQRRVVKAFYKQHFSTFDRQIVLVDCLQPLNAGYDSFYDMRRALEELLKSFSYGRNNVINRLFSPRIDKIIFAATKADHITPEQHENLVSLLQQMVHPCWQTAAFDGIEMNCMALASIQATEFGYIQQNGELHPALQGLTLEGNKVTLFPGEVPSKLPEKSFWLDQGFNFQQFKPLSHRADNPLVHTRVDKALEYLIGDKLK
ncbi:YcjX family protein [Vibrio caribbeanicus]|uniref:ATPase n=1 Tax=Vibrio caribbeanicus ATCC BAA-2122 TaxID=796620 RepID=E3BL31_9VIBR|nr:YcjX family protein [Vibrio caribbeanicus]EFP96375.1 hypothetical protein VIBC2010_12439 [Vibrio caribbeanicus ATCC BAA-2122]